VAGCCEHGNISLGSIEGWKFLDKLSVVLRVSSTLLQGECLVARASYKSRL
jgi:hypothetical protein